MTRAGGSRIPSGIGLGSFACRQAWRHGRGLVMGMLVFQIGTGGVTGLGVAAMLAALRSDELPLGLPGWAIVAGGTVMLGLAAVFRYLTTTMSFRLRWRLQGRLGDEVLTRVRDGEALVLQRPFRPSSAAAIASVAGGDAAHAAWFTQLLLNGLIPTFTASALMIAVATRNAWLLLPIVGMVVATLPLLWSQVHRVSRAAADFIDAGPNRSRGLRVLAQSAMDGVATRHGVADDIERFERARRDRMFGVQRLRLGTGFLVSVTVGGSVLVLSGVTATPTETVAYVAMLREALAAFAGVAAAAGSAARIQPRAERLRRLLEPASPPGLPADLPDEVVVHGLVRPDALAMCGAICERFGGNVVGGYRSVEGDSIAITWTDGRESVVRPWDRTPWTVEDGGEPDLHLAITGLGTIVAWDPATDPVPEFRPSGGDEAEAGMDDDEEEVF